MSESAGVMRRVDKGMQRQEGFSHAVEADGNVLFVIHTE